MVLVLATVVQQYQKLQPVKIPNTAPPTPSADTTPHQTTAQQGYDTRI